MSAVARELIAAVDFAGGKLRIVDGRVRVEALSPLPCELMERLRAVKGDVFALLASAEPAQFPLTGADIAQVIEERAALAADSVPAAYLDGWARLNHQKPEHVSETEWRRALDDGGRFLEAWGSNVAEAGWTPAELFDFNAGLIWRLADEHASADSRIGSLGWRLAGRSLWR